VTAVTIEGPRFSTLAESRLHQSWGCDIVNMTTVPEAQLAAELGLIYASLALVTDYDVWHESDDECVSVELVTNRLKQLAQRAKNVLVLAVKKVSQTDWTQVWTEKQNTAKSAIMTE
jgi:5'-methylthioadenosine phosphorylase